MYKKILSKQQAREIGVKNLDVYAGQELTLDNEIAPTQIQYKEPTDDQSHIEFRTGTWQYGSYFVTEENLAPPPDFTHYHDLNEDQLIILLFAYDTNLEDALAYFHSSDMTVLKNKDPQTLASIRDAKDMQWKVSWEQWVYNENGGIVAIHRYYPEFKIYAANLEEATKVAEAEAPRVLDQYKKEGDTLNVKGYNYRAHVIGLADAKRHYHELYPAREVWHGIIRKSDDSGDPDY